MALLCARRYFIELVLSQVYTDEFFYKNIHLLKDLPTVPYTNIFLHIVITF